MLAGKHDFIPLIQNSQAFADDTEIRPFRMVSLPADRHLRADRVSDMHRLDEAKLLVAVRERFGIDLPGSHPDANAENKRTVGDPPSEVLRLAPFLVHVMGIEIARLSRMQNNIRLGNRTSPGVAGISNPIILEENRPHSRSAPFRRDSRYRRFISASAACGDISLFRQA